MRTIDFHNIRPGNDGRRLAFEELVCQLGRRDPPPGAKEFRRVEGAGGDGGVEAYWVSESGKKVGYQAKYYLTVNEIDWSAIDESVTTALTKHPELERYVVAIPCDLTDKSGAKGRGKSGWEHWQRHSEKWTEAAKAKNQEITFDHWTAFELRSKLQEPHNAGLKSYWFDLEIYTPEWFETRLQSSLKDLDERYHPEDHVKVSISRIFDGLWRSPQLRDDLRSGADSILRAYEELVRDFGEDPHFGADGQLPILESNIRALLEASELAVNSARTITPISRWIHHLNAVETALEAIYERTHSHTNTEDRKLKLQRDLNRLGRVLGEFDVFLSSDPIAAYGKHLTLVTGVSGTGKSHLFADAAEQASKKHWPVVLVLGQHFRDEDPWEQVIKTVGLQCTREQFLGALDSAAETARVRAVLMIDALNEGAGLRLWRNRIAGFVNLISQYPHLAIAVSCRSEYVDRIIPENLRLDLLEVECTGFSTPEEQEAAARQYLEKRNIVRPASPWLIPEFTNPLFLRTCCNALRAAGETEFPRGLQGTKAVLAYYLASLSKNLDYKYAGSAQLIQPIRMVVEQLAQRMAANRRDYVFLDDAHNIASQSFSSFSQPENGTWLEILFGAGLLRRDPNPNCESEDPLDAQCEVVRFAFQRFSDHLIAANLLKHVEDVENSFTDAAGLAFLLDGHQFGADWIGVLEALAIQLPVERGLELVDVLPGGPAEWWQVVGVQQSFEQSLLWRSRDAFTPRTLDLLNVLDRDSDILRILVQLAVVQKHPWNSDFLDRNLMSRSMPDRDCSWSISLSLATTDESYPIHQIIDWSWRADKSNATDETLWLAGILLVWCFTSSSRPIRDRATKALSNVLVSRPSLCSKLLEHFGEVDDAYVLERLTAAIYGAACAIINPKHVSNFSAAVYKYLFLAQSVSKHLLTRDYALGVIEKAEHLGVLPSDIDLEACRPPFKSDLELDGLSEQDVNEVSNVAGDEAILHSSTWGDFGVYQIKHAVKNFAAIRLEQARPMSNAAKFACFTTGVVETGEPKRKTLLRDLRNALNNNFVIPFIMLAKGEGNQVELRRQAAYEEALSRHESLVTAAEQQFLETLSNSERTLYQELAVPYLFPERLPPEERWIPRIDLVSAQRWIITKAYSLGWTKERFTREQVTRGQNFRDRPVIERIGKKYQWIALHELLARLADNYWVLDSSESAKAYSTPADIGFLRDIDPTVIIQTAFDLQRQQTADINLIPTPDLPEVNDEDLLNWPARATEVLNSVQLLQPLGSDCEWLVLYDLIHRDEWHKQSLGQHGFRRTYFTRVSTLIILQQDLATALRSLERKRLTDGVEWEPFDSSDRSYLLEFPWRSTWPADGLATDHPEVPERNKRIRPVQDYIWEGHLDITLSQGLHVHAPARWLAQKLSLRPRPASPWEFEDSTGTVLFRSVSRGLDNLAAVISRRAFTNLLEREELACLWIVAGERTAWPRGSNEVYASLYHNAVYQLKGDSWTRKYWSEEEGR